MIDMTEASIRLLMEMMSEHCEPEEMNKRVTLLWRLNSLLMEYGKAFAKIAPVPLHASSPAFGGGSDIVTPSCKTITVGHDDDNRPSGGAVAIPLPEDEGQYEFQLAA